MKNACCFIGHRKVENAAETEAGLKAVLQTLIARGITKFIFGDHSEFNRLCYDAVTKLKEEFPQIERIHFRKDYPQIDDWAKPYFLSGFEDSVFPKEIEGSGRAAYVERNQAMITASEVCVFYYNSNYRPKRRKESKNDLCTYQPKSGTQRAFEFAEKCQKEIINLYE